MSDLQTSPGVKKPLLNDRAIHIWANRGSDFVSGRFAQNLEFQKLQDSKDWNELRKILMLDRQDTDNYIFRAMTLVDKYKGILNQIDDNNFTQRVVNLPVPKAPTILDGVLVNHENRYSKFLHYELSFPIPSTYIISYDTESSLEITTDMGSRHTVNTTIIQSYGDPPKPLGYTNLVGEWGDLIPFKGVIQYPGLWNLGSRITINYEPQSINYNKWVESIDSQISVIPFLEGVNQLEAYTLAKDSTEKLALLYLSLILHYDIESSNG